MTKRTVTFAVVTALALAAHPVLAQHSRGGGHSGGGHSGGGRSGGGHSGGGYAVPRGGSGHYAPGGGAAARHPSPGGGYGYSHGPGYGHGGYPAYGHGGYGHGGYYPRYGYGYYPRYGYGYYAPYYGGYYGGYYGSSFGFYLGFGAPYGYGSVYYGSPYGYAGAPYGYGPTTHVYTSSPDVASSDESPDAYRPQEPARRSDGYVPNTGRVRLEVRPDDASVYVDDEFWGNASDSRRMTLRAGRHAIEIVRPGFAVTHRDVEVVSGATTDVLVELRQP